jgi:hypothetical protein
MRLNDLRREWTIVPPVPVISQQGGQERALAILNGNRRHLHVSLACESQSGHYNCVSTWCQCDCHDDDERWRNWGI